jgi:hypothetical protein
MVICVSRFWMLCVLCDVVVETLLQSEVRTEGLSKHTRVP